MPVGLVLVLGLGRARSAPVPGQSGDAPALQKTLHLFVKRTCAGQVEPVLSILSMMKRRVGSALGARTYWSQCHALLVKAITHNLLNSVLCPRNCDLGQGK